MRSGRSWRSDEGGQMLVLLVVSFLAITMMVGLAVDAGQLYVARRTAQEAADAAAYAGAVVHYQRTIAGSPLDGVLARAAAINDATLNGFTDGANSVALTVSTPPATGPFTGDARYVEVVITQQVRTSIVPGGGLTTVRVRGVAGSEPLNNKYAIMALDRGNRCPGFATSPNADVHLTGGGIQVNSTCTTGTGAAENDQNDPSRFTIQSPYPVDVNGSATGPWPPSIPVNTGQPQRPDPFAGYLMPTTGGLPTFSSLPGGSTKVLDPGIYTVRIDGAGGTTFILKPGIYILKAGIDLAGNADLYSAGLDTPPTCAANCGILLFNTHTNYPGGLDPALHTCGATNLQGNAAVKVAAMQTGTYQGMLFYQDPACTTDIVIGGNGVFEASGSVYVPSGHFRFDGNNATLTGSQLVARTVDLQNGNIDIDFNAGNTAQPILPRLAE